MTDSVTTAADGPTSETGLTVAGGQPLDLSTLALAPKVLLHDHLDGGLRPSTVLELATEVGYDDLPATDADSLARWFREAADSGSLERYLETFAPVSYTHLTLPTKRIV